MELITLLTKSSEGKNIPIPFPQFNQSADCYYREDWKYYYQDKMSELVSDRGEDGKEIYQDILKLIGESKINKEKVKNIFVVVPKRGVMIKLKAEEIKMN